MNKICALWLRLCLICVALLLVSCGGDGGLVALDTGGGGISGTGVTVAARGTITGFGSVFVNGTEYFTDNATRINVNGLAANETALRIGMLVDVQATQNGNQTTATSINYQGNLRGPVTSIDADNQLLRIVSQPVDLSQAVLQGFGNITDLQADDIVEISGYLTSQGQWIATYVQVEAGAASFKLEGHIAEHDTANSTFFIGEQQIDYRQSGMMSNRIFEGALVSVEGVFDSDSRVLRVTDIVELDKHEPLATEGARVELEGLITQVESSAQFSVGRWLVDASEAIYKQGSDADIRVDTKVEIEGQIKLGIFVAETIEIEE
ncbi:MAG: hypothetical protein GW875_02445 [Deltaproteobacteria bacterium]|nr:hypothetical protein [Deltaproteobacteria bacterium]NCP03444.1 hypothetical protein [Deltaproteobacteria bacterium]